MSLLRLSGHKNYSLKFLWFLEKCCCCSCGSWCWKVALHV